MVSRHRKICGDRLAPCLRLRNELTAKSSVASPPLTLVTQFVDVLTHRLLRLQEDLLEPAEEELQTLSRSSPLAGGSGRRSVENVVLHRNHLEMAELTGQG